MKISYLSKHEYFLEDIVVKNLQNQMFCVFDLEGTGINFETEHITQIGAVILENGKIKREFSSNVKPSKPIPPDVEELTGISNEMIKDAPSFPETYEKFLDFCDGTVLVTQAGYEYDVPLLQNHCRIYGSPIFNNPVLDIKALFANIHQEYEGVISTNFLVDFYRINQTDVPRHNALGDSILISRLFSKILDEYARKNVKDFDIPEGLTIKRFTIPGMYLDQN